MKTALCALLAAAACAPATGQIAVPATINYQGVLVDSSGNKLPDGNTNVIFKVWDAIQSGNLIWGPKTNSVAVVGGVFNTLVGGLDSASPTGRDFGTVLTGQALTPNSPAFLELSVGASSVQPRQQILSTPFAFVANTANTAAFATNAANATNAVSAAFASSSGHANQADHASTSDTATRSVNADALQNFRWSDLLSSAPNSPQPLKGAKLIDQSVEIGKLTKQDQLSLVYQTPAIPGSMRIVTGAISADGSVLQGSGFSVVGAGTIASGSAIYQIVFNNKFFGRPPTVFVTQHRSDATVLTLTPLVDFNSTITDRIFVEFHGTVNGVQNSVTIATEFSFLAIGTN